MRKKLFLLFVSALISVPSLSGCTVTPTTLDSSEHVCSFCEEWEYDDSYHWHDCHECGKINEKYLHRWNEGIVSVEPTETAVGSKTYTCLDCGYVKVESIPALGHVHHIFDKRIINDEYLKTPQTCTEGAVYYYACECGEKSTFTYIVGEGKGHSYSQVWDYDESNHWHSATCEHTDEIKDKGSHDYILKFIAPTCMEEGYDYHLCRLCGYGYKDNYTSLGDHHFVETDRQEATCIQDGYIRYECDVEGCNEYRIDTLEALEHSFTNYVSNNDATCVADGTKTAKCDRCDATDTIIDINSKLEHTFNNEVISDAYLKEEANCQHPAVYYYSCSCGEAGTETFTYGEVGEHDYGEWIYDNDPSSPNYGTKKRNCSLCNHIIQEQIEEKELLNQSTSFSFLVHSSKELSYIESNIKIFDVILDSETTNDFVSYSVEPTSTSNVYEIFGHDKIVTKEKEVIQCDGYINGTTYKVILPEDISFVDYDEEVLTFSIEGSNTQSVKANSDLIFLRALENVSSGYYPYYMDYSKDEDCINLTLNKIDNLSTGKIIVLGEILSIEEIESIYESGDKELLNDITIGNISSITDNKDGTYLVKLTQPELSKVFDELDLNYNEEIELPDNEEVKNNFKASAMDQIVNNESFMVFLSSVNSTTEKYATKNKLQATKLTKANFADMVHIEPSVKVDGTKVKLSIIGYIGKDKNGIELLTKSGDKYGYIKIGFDIETIVGFEFNASYKLKYFWFIPTGIDYFDISITQTDSFDFSFNVDINIDYDLNKSEEALADKQTYYHNVESGEVHTIYCTHIKSVDLTSSTWEKIDTKEMMSICSNSDGSPNSHECAHCRPYTRLNNSAFVYNLATHTLHCICCAHVNQMSDENKYIYYGSYASFPKDKYPIENLCDWCHPELVEKQAFENELLEDLMSCDWADKVKEIKQWMSESNVSPYSRNGINIFSMSYPVYFLSIGIDIRYVLSFDLTAKLSCTYSQSHTNVFGARIENGSVSTYSSHKETSDGPTLDIVGRAKLKTGLEVDAYVSIVGLSHWVQVGLFAQVGVYVEVEGILHLSTKDNNYAAAKLEVGAYLDVGLYYKLLLWSGETTIISLEWPIFTFGYDKVYFSYTNPITYLEVEDSYLLDNKDLLNVMYFDVENQTSSKEVLSFESNNLYSVSLSLKDGFYCYLEDDKLIIKNDAPLDFEDELIIYVNGETKWTNYVKGSSAFYLGEERIKIIHHGYSSSYSYNSSYHWRSAICDHGDKITDKESHSFTHVVTNPTCMK